jgi:hypothetical protein
MKIGDKQSVVRTLLTSASPSTRVPIRIYCAMPDRSSGSVDDIFAS